MANEKFKKALYDAIVPEYVSALPDIDGDEHEFSPEFEKKMKKLIKRRNKPYYRIINTVGKRAACIAVIILAASSVTVMSVEALRNAVADFFVRIYEKFSTVQSVEDDDFPMVIEDIYGITSDLTGFTIVYEDHTEYSRHITYMKNDIIINYEQYTKDMYDKNVNTEDTEFSTIMLNNYEAIYFHDNHNYDNLIFDNGDYIISISSNIGENALIDIAKSVQKIE